MDGVLNSDEFFKQSSPIMDFGEGQIDPKLVANLNQLVNATGAKIVISSSWRHVWDHEEIEQMLVSKGFQHQGSVIDRTPESEGGFRGKEIEDWIALHAERKVVDDQQMPIESFVILDDNNDFTTTQQQHFVHTNPKRGLSTQDVKKAIGILNGGLNL
jgi:hypothetical protein